MRKGVDWRVSVGLIALLGGVVFLLENLEVIDLGDLFWGILLSLVGIFLIVYFVRYRLNALILFPGVSLLSIGCLELVRFLAPDFRTVPEQGFILAVLALSFYVVYLAASENWWALVPGGVFATLAGYTLIEQYFPQQGLDLGSSLFIGLGFTFLLVFLLPSRLSRNPWAIFPSLAFFLMGVLILISTPEIINYLWPVVLILMGVVLLVRNYVWERY